MFSSPTPIKFFSALLLLAAALFRCSGQEPAAQTPPPAERPPNILLIVADDLGWADLNCYGNPLIESPHLDRLARGGVQFMQAYAAAPAGAGTRASILTGRHPARLGLTQPEAPVEGGQLRSPATAPGLPLDQLTLAEVAVRAGMRTAHLGQWQLGDRSFHPSLQGFGEVFGGGEENDPASHYYPFFSGNPYPELLDETREEDYLTDALTNHTLHLLEEWRDTSWFISLNYYAPGLPIEGRKDWISYYEQLVEDTHPREFPSIEYAAMVSAMDENIGRLLEYLEQSEQLDRTLIIFTSDNGGLHRGGTNFRAPTDNGILREGKETLYEGGIRVPLLIHYKKEATTDAAIMTPVITTDIFHTITDLLGVPPAGESDGQSLLPLLRGHSLPQRTLYWHFPHYGASGGKPAASLRREDLKMILDYETDSVVYYHLGYRPDEAIPLATPPEEDFRALLLEWQQSVNARLPER
ncbi:sulfatase-like hydrolase/transferase [Lewinella sp. W8]|uniref:sulfatase-like hydrolase/transferase n=1 Tax=Lewinella sp. W8 TaxID=2528208 RepID=UPI001567059A|nr:sulfatase-like hydrolase/transferase [Lewinella sp. W8]